MSELNGYTVPDSIIAVKAGPGAHRALVEAVAAALPILSAERDSIIESNTMSGPDGKPDLSTLDEDAKPYVAEFDHAIALCEAALVKAGVR